MTGSARETRAARALLTRSAEQFTGRLTVQAGGVELSVHLLQGDLIAATSPHDVSRVVRVLTARGELTPQDAQFFEREIAEGAQVFGAVLDVAEGPLLDAVLRDRFIQNIADFVAVDVEPHATAGRSVFVENVQLGHDTPALVLATCNDYDVAMQLEEDQLLVRGIGKPRRGASRAMLVELLSDVPRTVADIIASVPMEPLRARRLLVELIDVGVAEDSTETDTVVPVGPDAPRPVPPTPPLPEPEPALEPVRAVQAPNAAEDVSDVDLAAFDDHDQTRGHEGAGTFSTEEHHRDLVEVTDMPAASLSPDPVVRFAGPQVQEGQARNKIRVANEVLRKVSAALDAEQGHGRGKAAMQLLVAGGPSRYSVLTQDLPVADDGCVSEAMLLMNLRKRPAAEQHQLLHNSLVDLIERALSTAADNLSEDVLDGLFDSVAGYRSRMGR